MSLRKLDLVIVDDDAAMVRVVEHMVRQRLSEQFASVAFTEPREALEWINDHGCDVLLSDIQMPGLGGLDLLRAAKKVNPGLRTIFLTAHSSWDRIAQAIENGATHYLLKPVNQAELHKLLTLQYERITCPPGVCDMLGGTTDCVPATV